MPKIRVLYQSSGTSNSRIRHWRSNASCRSRIIMKPRTALYKSSTYCRAFRSTQNICRAWTNLLLAIYGWRSLHDSRSVNKLCTKQRLVQSQENSTVISRKKASIIRRNIHSRPIAEDFTRKLVRVSRYRSLLQANKSYMDFKDFSTTCVKPVFWSFDSILWNSYLSPYGQRTTVCVQVLPISQSTNSSQTNYHHIVSSTN